MRRILVLIEVAVVVAALGGVVLYNTYVADPDVPMPDRHKTLPGVGAVQDISCTGVFKGQKPGESILKDQPDQHQEMLKGGRDTIIGNDCKGRLYHIDDNGELTKPSSEVNIEFIKRRDDKSIMTIMRDEIRSSL